MAVLPIMLGVVLLVAVIRPADPSATPVTPASGQGERYISVRHVAALKTFEQAIVRREGATPVSPSGADVLAGLPSCKSEWDAKWRAAGPSQAERIAAQLASLDKALLQFSSRANARVEAPVGLDDPAVPSVRPGKSFSMPWAQEATTPAATASAGIVRARAANRIRVRDARNVPMHPH